MSSLAIPDMTSGEATRARLARYRRRMELHIEAARIRRAAPRRLAPETAAVVRAVIEKFGRIEANGGLWLMVGEGVGREVGGDLWKVLAVLEAAGLVRRAEAGSWWEAAGKGSEAASALRFVVALEPRQAWRWRLVDKNVALRWEAAEAAEFRFVVETETEDDEESRADDSVRGL
jgi:hypothetical protein